MTEEIGKIKLDYSKYPGEDFYCDGSVEDELLDIVKTVPPSGYARVIEEKSSWPVLYHLSPLRENIVDWIPMEKGMKVLEVGSGCGAITGALSRKAGSVTCVELSKKRSLINAYRHRECENVMIHVGNFTDIEPGLPTDFDYICLIGVFEYGQAYIGGDTPYEDFLRILQAHLAEGGRIVIAIENKYGMKYFAGCREDHLGTYFSGIEDYRKEDGVRTFGRRGLERIFRDCGAGEAQFYYPYPDYKFMTALYSDSRLPGKGELSNNLRNFDRDRMLLFDEKRAFDSVVEEGLFSVFSNSYVAVLGGGFDLEYVKYSNDRAPEHMIRTEILREAFGEVCVRKYPLGEEAREHVREMATAFEKLRKRYEGGRLMINRCTLREDGEELWAQFEYVSGIPLSQLMDQCLDRGDLEGFYGYFREYVDRIGYNAKQPVADFDLIFANILVDGDAWTLIDYEWTFGKAIDTKELAYRAVYCYLLEDEKRKKLEPERILKELGITEAEAESFQEKEREFQHFVTGDRLAMAQLRERMGRQAIAPQKWLHRYEDGEQTQRVQIYEDRGQGFREEDSYFVKEAYQGPELIELELTVGGDVRQLRIDPAFASCVVKLQEMTFNGEAVPLDRRKMLQANGSVTKPGRGSGETYRPVMVFSTEDPYFSIALDRLARREENRLYARMEIYRLPLEVARKIRA